MPGTKKKRVNNRLMKKTFPIPFARKTDRGSRSTAATMIINFFIRTILFDLESTQCSCLSPFLLKTHIYASWKQVEGKSRFDLFPSAQLILMVINLPDISDIVALKKHKSFDETVIAVSVNAMKAGFTDYIVKPII